ncbi:MAG: hypothetical protein Q8L57_03930, partial [bacterium]|nr:hypothetical protein [bacterium]
MCTLPLPLDPVNSFSSGAYYSYVTGGSWEFNTRLESNKLGYAGSENKTAKDGGNNDYLYEVGTNLVLLLDPENRLKDGDMERSDTSYWADYGFIVLKEKVSAAASGQRSLHLITSGYTGGVNQDFSLTLPAS